MLNLGTEVAPRVFGEKNAQKVIEALSRTRSLPLARWLLAFAIPDVGEETAHDLGRYFPDLEAIVHSTLLRDTAEYGELNRLFDENKIGKQGVDLAAEEKQRRKANQKKKLKKRPFQLEQD